MPDEVVEGVGFEGFLYPGRGVFVALDLHQAGRQRLELFVVWLSEVALQ